jgi:DnaJ-domain-containing protein 1
MHGRTGRAGGNYFLCAGCGGRLEGDAGCGCAGAGERVRVVRGYVVAVPAGTLPCAGCGAADRPLELRGWSRLLAFGIGVRERRRAGYVCVDCAHSETLKSLLLTALLGWWSLPSVLFYAPRATVQNWRAAWTHPANPGRWGAVAAADFRSTLFAAAADGGGAGEGVDDRIWDSPLRHLSRSQTQRVIAAEGLYELLGVRAGAGAPEIRAAYRARCKEIHPDLHADAENAAEGNERMAQLNDAWEILRAPELRAAYDWLAAQQREPVAA